jgi:hypothetical protein
MTHWHVIVPVELRKISEGLQTGLAKDLNFHFLL